jgi:hypothetical protein
MQRSPSYRCDACGGVADTIHILPGIGGQMPLTVELACADHDPGGYWFTIENWEHGTIRQHIQDSKFRADEAIPLVTERLTRKQPEYGPLVSFTREITPELEADLATVVKLVQRRPGLSFV